jgi:hypothetical protein
VSERLGDRHFKGAHTCLEAHEALIYGLEPPIDGLEPPIHGLEPLMDFRPEALQPLVHQEHAFGHQLDPRPEILSYDIEVAAGLRIANPHLSPHFCPQLVEAPIHLGEAAVHGVEAPVQIGDKLRVHAGTLPLGCGSVKCIVDRTRSALREVAQGSR